MTEFIRTVDRGQDRYSRQTLLAEIGSEGQRRLEASSALVVGCGALGSVVASSLVRMGAGHVKIVDRDYIELNNLQRQILFDEHDIARGLPKAVAAAEKLARMNSGVKVEPVVADVSPQNVEALVSDMDLVFDGTDSFETRLLLNDACVKHGLPWVYGGVIGTHGMTMAIIPGRTACFRCFVAEVPPPGSTPTCDTVGVLGPAANVIASLEVVEGLKILMGREDQLHAGLLYIDVWTGTFERLSVSKGEVKCPACDEQRFDFLGAEMGSYVTSLCGRNAVQVSVRGAMEISFPVLAARLANVGSVRFNEYMLHFQEDSRELTVFPDGRAIIKGTSDEAVARSLYARYVGL